MKRSKKNQNRNRSRRSPESHTRATNPSQKEFFEFPWTTAAVTFKPGLGILAIAPAFRHEDGSWGYPPHAQVPITSVDHLEGSYLAFVKGVPPDEVGMIYAACCAGDFLGALGQLAILYNDGDDSTRGILSSSIERSRILKKALTFRRFSALRRRRRE